MNPRLNSIVPDKAIRTQDLIKMQDDFAENIYHDSIITSIIVDRNRPGVNDTILLNIKMHNSQERTVEFYECYACKVNMNFGVIAEETILSAECITESTEIDAILKKWSDININISGLRCYKIFTNSTGSEISIFCIGCRVVSQY